MFFPGPWQLPTTPPPRVVHSPSRRAHKSGIEPLGAQARGDSEHGFPSPPAVSIAFHGRTIMKLKPINFAASTGIIVIGMSAFIGGASSGSHERPEKRAEYGPRQAMSYGLGSKFISGYFVEQAAQCLVNLMIIEKSDPDSPVSLTAARVRLILNPGQVAGLDSEEGPSLNITCDERGARVFVDVGERQTMVAQQATNAVRQAIFEAALPASNTPGSEICCSEK
jgi:hypothetical protein